jgi:hypothetical protein
MKLYELTEMYQNVWNLIEDEDIDIETLEMALTQIEESIESKAEGMAKLIKSIDGDIAALKEEENRLAKKRKTLENKQKNIKTYLEYQLIGMGIDKVKTPLFTVALQNNPPSVRFIDEDLIPEEYKVRTELVSIPKKLILDDIKEGIEVAGCELVQGKSLRIR